jgi:hypothetical protein
LTPTTCSNRGSVSKKQTSNIYINNILYWSHAFDNYMTSKIRQHKLKYFNLFPSIIPFPKDNFK